MADSWARATWKLTNHICRACGGRILLSASGIGPTGGGNPMWICADCERAGSAMDSSHLCWCGSAYRNGESLGYRCVRTDEPRLRAALAACGCLPERQIVGIVMEKDLHKALAVTPVPPKEA